MGEYRKISNMFGSRPTLAKISGASVQQCLDSYNELRGTVGDRGTMGKHSDLCKTFFVNQNDFVLETLMVLE